jgi:hypothetical protein
MSSTAERNTQLKIYGMSMLDYKDMLPSNIESPPSGTLGCSFTREQRNDRAHGDLTAGVIVLALAPSVIAAFAAFINRRRKKTDLTIDLEKIEPDGTQKRAKVHFRRETAEVPPADVIRQIGKELNLDVEKLLREE